MIHKKVSLVFSLFLCIGSFFYYDSFAQKNISPVKKRIVLNAGVHFQTIDGFGTNINPAYWMNGKLKPVLDSLVKDLGSTWLRFDCYGRANWLDPSKQLPDGHFPNEYLQQVYTSPEFKDAWACFRYLNSLGVEPIFNISGAIPYEWSAENPVPKTWTNVAGSTHDRLKNFDAYATMVVTLLVWAREKEGLKFSLLMPFNETDLGFPEGPRLLDEDCVPAFNAIINKLREYNLSDISCVIMDDSGLNTERIKYLVTKLPYPEKIKGIGVHTYGNGSDEDGMGGGDGSKNNRYARAREIMDDNGYQTKSYLLTEYGDLDQSGEIEFEIGWRSTRRLLKCLNGGMTGAMQWDAFDNFHKHDTAFALYGLFYTDTLQWKYASRPRYFAAKQVFRFVLPGFQRISIKSPEDQPNYIYNEWKYTLRNMLLSAYRSPDGKGFTLTGLNSVERDVELTIQLENFSPELENQTIGYFRTRQGESCKKIQTVQVKNKSVTVTIPPKSIFTLTTVQR